MKTRYVEQPHFGVNSIDFQASLFEDPEDTPQDGKNEFPILFQYSDIHQSTDEQIQPNGDLSP